MRPSMDSIVQSAALRLKDKANHMGQMSQAFLECFCEEITKELIRHYSAEEARQYLDRIGMKPNVIRLQDGSIAPRSGSRPFTTRNQRTYNPDGTYTVDGVVFGTPRTDLTSRIFLDGLPRRSLDKLKGPSH